jgi:hypothetical protein
MQLDLSEAVDAEEGNTTFHSDFLLLLPRLAVLLPDADVDVEEAGKSDNEMDTD